MNRGTLLLLILLFLIIIYFQFNCGHSFKTVSGRRYKARNLKTAELIDILRDISIDLSYEINELDGKKLRKRLQNTSFKELINKDPNILAWNYDKGREIGIKVYDSSSEIYSPDQIITALFHELAHSLIDKLGHAQEWKDKNNYLLTFKRKYLNILIDKSDIFDE